MLLSQHLLVFFLRMSVLMVGHTMEDTIHHPTRHRTMTMARILEVAISTPHMDIHHTHNLITTCRPPPKPPLMPTRLRIRQRPPLRRFTAMLSLLIFPKLIVTENFARMGKRANVLLTIDN